MWSVQVSLVIPTAGRDHLWPETSYLIIAYQLLQLIRVNDNVKTTQLCKAELLPIHTCRAHLWEGRPDSVSVPKTGHSATTAGRQGCNYKCRNSGVFIPANRVFKVRF